MWPAWRGGLEAEHLQLTKVGMGLSGEADRMGYLSSILSREKLKCVCQ